MMFIQRPEYPFYSLSLTAAVVQLIIYKYIYGYHNEEVLMDSLILEKIKEVKHFVKTCWNFNSIKFLEKIQQYKSSIYELTFFRLIHITDLIIIKGNQLSLFLLD